jgi:hypothetical protein
VVPKNPIDNRIRKYLAFSNKKMFSLLAKISKIRKTAAIRLVKLAKKSGGTKETPYFPKIG